MSEQVASTVIAIGIDDSGVEAGAKRVERSIATLGKNVTDSAKAAGNSIASLGDGADKASSTIDRETKKIEAQLQRVLLITTAGTKGTSEYYAALANAKGANLATLKPYLDQLDQVNLKTKVAADANLRLSESTRFLESLKNQSEGLGKSASQLAAMRAAELGVADAAAPMIAKMAAAEQGLGKVGMSAAATAAAMRNVPAQFTDIVVSLQAGQKPMTVLLQQGGQLKDMFGGVGNAAQALGTYVAGLINPLTVTATAVVALGAAMYTGYEQTKRLQSVLITSGNFAGTTAAELNKIAESAGRITGKFGDARDAVAALAESGNFSENAIKNLSIAIVAAGSVTGKSIQDNVADFEKLKKEPLTAIVALNEKYNFLTVDIYKQIKALEQRGETEKAGALAANVYFDTVQNRNKEIVANLGFIEKAWKGIKAESASALDTFLSFGRATSDAEKLPVMKNQLASMKQSVGNVLPDSLAAQEIRGREAQIAEIEKRVQAQYKLTVAVGETTREQKKATEQEKTYQEYISNSTRLTKSQAFEEESKKFTAAILGPVAALSKFKEGSKEYVVAFNQYKSALAANAVEIKKINEQFADKSGAAQLKKEENAYAAIILRMKERSQVLDEEIRTVKAATASDKIYIDLQTKLSEGLARATKEQLDYARGLNAANKAKESLNIDVKNDLAKFEKDTIDRSKKLLDTFNNQVVAYGKVSEAADEYALSVKAGVAQNELELSLMGRSAVERETALEQYRIEIDLQKRIRDIKKQKLLNVDEESAIADVTATANLEKSAAELKAQKNEWGRFYSSIYDGLTDSLYRGFEAGKGFFQSFWDGIKNLFKTTVLKLAVQGVMTGMTGLTGALATAATGSGNNDSPLGSSYSLFSAGKSMWEGFSGGFTAITDKLGSAAQFAMNLKDGMTWSQASMTANSGAPLSSTASGVGFAGGIAAAVLAAMTYNNSLFKQGWNIKNGTEANGIGTLVNGGLPTNGFASLFSSVGAVKLSDSIMQKLGMSSQLASLFSGSSVIASLFGNKDPEITRKYITGTFGPGGFAGQTQADWFSKGGVFSSDKTGTAAGTLDTTFSTTLGDQYKAIKDATSDFAKTLGIDADYLKTRAQSISFDFGANDEETKANIAKLFSDISRDISTELLNIADNASPGFKALSKAGEDASTTLTRLAGDVQSADAFFKALSLSIPGASTANVAAKANLIEMSGGLEKFNAGAAFFVQNFLTEAEQIAPVMKDVTEKMTSLGLAGVTTVDQFKSTVKGIDFTTDSGIKLYAALQDLAPAFKLVADYSNKATVAETAHADAIKTLNDSIQGEIDALIKSTQTLEQQRAAERVGKDSSTIALLDKRDALQDKVKAEQDAEAKKQALLALTKSRTELEISLMEAMGNAEGALAARRKETLEATTDSISKELLLKTYAAQDAAKADQDLKTKADAAKAEAVAMASAAATAKQEYDRQVAADKQAYDQNISTLRGKLQTAYNNESSSLQEVINKHQAYADAAKQAADALTLGDLSPLNDRQKYSLLQSTLPDIIKQANLSNPDAIGQLQQFAELSKLTSSFDQYTSDLGLVNSTLVNTGTAAQTQATIAKNSLDVMKKQVDVMLGVETGVGTVAEQIAALNLAMAGGLQTVASAVYGQYQANNPATGKLVNTTTASSPQDILDAGPKQVVVADVYARYRQAETDSAMQFKAAKEAGFKGTESDYFDQFGGRFNLQEELDKALSAWRSSIPQFAVGGFHAGGLRIVGENGPELEVTGPSRIYNASQTAALLASGGASNGEMIAELRAMAARLEAIEANTQATAGHSNRSANVLEDATDGDALMMRSAT